MLLNTINQTLTFENTEGDLRPAAGVTCTVHRCGATVRSTVTHASGASKVIDVEGLNTIKVGDVLYHHTTPGTTMTVTAVDYTNRQMTVTLNTGATLTAGERLMVSDATVRVYNDEHQNTAAADNTLTTDSDGLVSGYTPLQQIDLYVAASGVYAADWILADVQIPTTRLFTPAYFGATGSGDEAAIIQQAVDRLFSYQIKKLYLDKYYTIGSTLDLPAGFTIEGMSRTGSGLIFTGSTGEFIGLGGAGITLRGTNLVSTGGSVSPQITVDQLNFTVDHCDISGGVVGLSIQTAGDAAHIRYTDITTTVSTINIAAGASSPRMEAVTLTATAAGGAALQMIANTADISNAYIGGNCILTASGASGKAINCVGTSPYVVELNISGLEVAAGDAVFTDCELMVHGMRVTPANLTVDTTTSQKMCGTFNDDLHLPNSGTPSDTPPTNTFPFRWEPGVGSGKLWVWNGSTWVYAYMGSKDYVDLGEHWEDSQVPGLFTQAGGGSNPPTWTQIQDDGAGSVGVWGYAFDDATSDDEVWVQVQLPHGWVEGSDIEPHIHWTPPTAAAGQVVWKIEYTWCNVGDVIPTTTTITTDGGYDSTNSTALEHLIAGFPTVSGTGKEVSSMFLARIYRDVSDANDTYAADAFLLSFDIHIKKNSIGSDLEFSKT